MLDYKTVVMCHHLKKKSISLAERERERGGIKTFREQKFGGIHISDAEILTFYKRFTNEPFLTFK